MPFGSAGILMYHAVGRITHDPNLLFTSPERFEAQMLHLKRRGWRGVSMREWRQAVSRGDAKSLVGLTFDDGDEGFLRTVVPMLERLGFSATVFVVAGLLGEENVWEFRYEPRPRLRILTPEELREISERGMEVGSHTMSHPRLAGLEPRQLDEEVSGSRKVLSKILGEEVEGFCYPYGSCDRAAIKAARRTGYTYACAWKVHFEHSYYDLPRIPVSEKDTSLRFAAKLRVYPQYARMTSNFGNTGGENYAAISL
jgi:peptidoglycan/xylan/chitin deacetylase (PgdA/CDA1 family)